MDVYTRKQYMDASSTDEAASWTAHRKFYAQFVTSYHKKAVEERIGLGLLATSKDVHFNDVTTMREWDSVFAPGLYKNWNPGHNAPVPGHHGISAALLKATGENGVSWSVLTCVLKEAARQLLEARTSIGGGQ